MDVLVEACVTSLDEAVSAADAGVDRLELCDALDVGGLTPPDDLVSAVVARVEVPVLVMVRPRGGPYRVRSGDMGRLLVRVEGLAAAGAAGFVTGWLAADGAVDSSAMAELVAAAAGRPVTFHRAFDHASAHEAALESLVDLGVARILTGGGPGRAWEGRDRLRRLVKRAGNRITILAGGGVRGEHVAALVEETGVGEVHARAVGVAGIMQMLRRRA